MRINLPGPLPPLALGLAAMLLGACSNDPDPFPVNPPPPPAMATFDVTVTNLTNAQPLSPVAVVAHQDGYAVFDIGAPASAGLEELAEGGDNSSVLAEADADAAVFASASGGGPIGPAGSETISITVLERELPDLLVSTSSMLVNTNDAITGANGVAIGALTAAATAENV